MIRRTFLKRIELPIISRVNLLAETLLSAVLMSVSKKEVPHQDHSPSLDVVQEGAL